MDNKNGSSDYELNKSTIKGEILTPKEYEQRIKELCQAMNI